MARQDFFSKEAELISQANELLEKVTGKEAVKDLSEWDVFSTRDTMVLDEDSIANLTTLSAEGRGRHIQRKSTRCVRRGKELESSLNDCLAEIEQQCSAQVFGTVRKVVEEYRRLKVRVYEQEKKEKGLKAQERLIEEYQ